MSEQVDRMFIAFGQANTFSPVEFDASNYRKSVAFTVSAFAQKATWMMIT